MSERLTLFTLSKHGLLYAAFAGFFANDALEDLLWRFDTGVWVLGVVLTAMCVHLVIMDAKSTVRLGRFRMSLGRFGQWSEDRPSTQTEAAE